MDNNRYSSNRPRRKVSRRTYRNRRLAALAIISLLILVFVVFIAKACKSDDKKPAAEKKASSTLTTTTTATDAAITTTVTTTAAVTLPSNDSDFKLDKRTVILEVLFTCAAEPKPRLSESLLVLILSLCSVEVRKTAALIACMLLTE